MLKLSSDYEIPNFEIRDRLISLPQSFIDNMTYLHKLLTTNSEFKETLKPLLETNKKTFFHLLRNAFIFEKESRLLSVNLDNWLRHCSVLEINRMEILDIALSHSKHINIGEYIEQLVLTTKNDELIILLELFVDNFRFEHIYSFFQATSKHKNQEEQNYLTRFFSEKANEKMNFLNLLLCNNHKTDEKQKNKTILILSKMKDPPINLKIIANLQKKRHKSESQHEKDRFSLRFELLISSGLFDADPTMKNLELLEAEELSRDPYSISYLFSHFTTLEKSMFIDIMRNRIKFLN